MGATSQQRLQRLKAGTVLWQGNDSEVMTQSDLAHCMVCGMIGSTYASSVMYAVWPVANTDVLFAAAQVAAVQQLCSVCGLKKAYFGIGIGIGTSEVCLRPDVQ